MSKRRTIPYAVLTMSLLAASGASAQSMRGIDQRDAGQQQRIDTGRRDGSLTRTEAYRLEQGEQRINRNEARTRADGVVTPGERQRLDGMLDREGRQINRERNDGQRAGGHDNGNHYGWDRGNHNGWSQADAGRNGWAHDPRSDNGRNDHGRNHDGGTHSGQPPAPGSTPPAHTGWNGNGHGTGQGAGQTNGQHSWSHQPGTNGTPAAPPATTAPRAQANAWGHGGAQARVMPASAPVSPAVAAPRTAGSGGRPSRR